MRKLKLLFLLIQFSLIPLSGFADSQMEYLTMKVGDVEVLKAPDSPDEARYPHLSDKTTWSCTGNIEVTNALYNSSRVIKATSAGTATVVCNGVFWDARVVTSGNLGWVSRTKTWYITIEGKPDPVPIPVPVPDPDGKKFVYHDYVDSKSEEGVPMTFWIWEEYKSTNNKWECGLTGRVDSYYNVLPAISKSTKGKVTIPEIVPGTKGCSVKDFNGQVHLDLDGLLVTSIDENAFSECKNLTEVVIPASVDYIGANAFYGCTSLERITLLGSTPPKVKNEAVFAYDWYTTDPAYSKLIIQVPKGAKSAYRNADVWKKFSNILEEGESIPIPVNKITLNETKLSMSVKDTKQLTATVKPDNASDKSVTWSSSDKNVATVSSKGLVTAIGAGSATITCKANDGSGVTATCQITVSTPIPDPIPVTKITLNETKLSMSVKDTKQLSATVKPDNASDKSVTWSSSDKNVATVSNTGLVTAVSAGSATITCKANDGSGVKATCSITVTTPVTEPNISFVSIVCSSMSNLTQNDKLNVSATFLNTGATANIRTILAILNVEKNKILYRSEEDVRLFTNGKNTSIEYVYPLRDVPAGEYYATVMYYQDWGEKEDQGWYCWNDLSLYSIKIISEPTPSTKGDVNGDGEVNVTDIVTLVNIIIGKNKSTAAADVNGDGEVNVTDIVTVINIILGKSNSRTRGDSVVEAATDDLLMLDGNEDGSLSLNLSNQLGYVASQFDLILSDGQQLEGISLNTKRSAGHQMVCQEVARNHYRVITYSLNNRQYEGNSGEMLNIGVKGSGSVAVENIKFVTADQQTNTFAPLYSNTTGIEAVTTGELLDIYTTNGILVRRQVKSTAGLEKGVYIINGKKQIVK